MTDHTCACGAACPDDTAERNGIARVDGQGFGSRVTVAPGVRAVDPAAAAKLKHICPVCWAAATAPKVDRADSAAPQGARMDRMG